MPKCKYCGKLPELEDAEMCNNCWELDKRVQGNLIIADMIVTLYKYKEYKKILDRK